MQDRRSPRIRTPWVHGSGGRAPGRMPRGNAWWILSLSSVRRRTAAPNGLGIWFNSRSRWLARWSDPRSCYGTTIACSTHLSLWQSVQKNITICGRTEMFGSTESLDCSFCRSALRPITLADRRYVQYARAYIKCNKKACRRRVPAWYAAVRPVAERLMFRCRQ